MSVLQYNGSNFCRIYEKNLAKTKNTYILKGGYFYAKESNNRLPA